MFIRIRTYLEYSRTGLRWAEGITLQSADQRCQSFQDGLYISRGRAFGRSAGLPYRELDKPGWEMTDGYTMLICKVAVQTDIQAEIPSSTGSCRLVPDGHQPGYQPGSSSTWRESV